MFLACCLFWFEPLYSCTVRRCLVADGESNLIISVCSDAEKNGCEGNRISAEWVCACVCVCVCVHVRKLTSSSLKMEPGQLVVFSRQDFPSQTES